MADEAVQERVVLNGFELRRGLLIGGGGLIGIGGLLGLAGVALVSSAVLSATRQWVARMDPPPAEIARRRWRQARVAAAAGAVAGASAWRNGLPDAPATAPAPARTGRTATPATP